MHFARARRDAFALQTEAAGEEQSNCRLAYRCCSGSKTYSPSKVSFVPGIRARERSILSCHFGPVARAAL